VKLERARKDAVLVSGGSGSSRPDTLKVSVGFRDGFLGEGQISYAGPNASERAHLAAEVVIERLLSIHRLETMEIRADYLGENSAFRGATKPLYPPAEVRLRLAAKTWTKEEAQLVGREVQALYTNGPAGGGGARSHVEEIIGVVSTLMDRSDTCARTEVFESKGARRP
jgi:Acyclic terpene utilisation family protein AtuA